MRREIEDNVTQVETLRFRGREIDCYKKGNSYFTLYKCPGGYRVYIENGDGTASLNPSRHNSNEPWDYPTYSKEHLVENYPAFREAVGLSPEGIPRIRDLDKGTLANTASRSMGE